MQVSTECDAHLSYDTQATIDKVSGSGAEACIHVSPCYSVPIITTDAKKQHQLALMQERLLAGSEDHGPVLEEGRGSQQDIHQGDASG